MWINRNKNKEEIRYMNERREKLMESLHRSSDQIDLEEEFVSIKHENDELIEKLKDASFNKRNKPIETKSSLSVYKTTDDDK